MEMKNSFMNSVRGERERERKKESADKPAENVAEC